MRATAEPVGPAKLYGLSALYAATLLASGFDA